MKKLYTLVLGFLISAPAFTGCSSDQMNPFQTNDPLPEYSLLHLFDAYPSLDDAISSLDTRTLNAKMADMLESGNDMPSFLRMSADLVQAPFLTDAVGELKELMDIIVDTDPKYNSGAAGDDGFYAANPLAPNHERHLYTGLDKILNNTELSEDILAIMAQAVSYLDAKDASELESSMQQLADMIGEDVQPGDQSDGTPDIRVTVGHMSELLGRLLVAADYPMWLEGGETGTLIQSRADIDPASDTNTGLGNAVLGMNLLLRGLSHLARTDATARDYIYDIIREDLAAIVDPASGGRDVMKQTIINLNNYFAPVGADPDVGHTHVYDTNTSYNNPSNPYVNAAFKQTLQELLPNLALLFIRDDSAADGRPDYAIAKDITGNGFSPIESVLMALKRLRDIGIDFSTPQYRIEPSLRTVFEYNAYGQLRSDPTPGIFQVGMLDHLVYTIASSYHFGYLTRQSWDGEPYDNSPGDEHWGHGMATGGILTINDSMYSLTSGSTFDKDSYGLALAKRVEQGQRIGRSSSYFPKEQLAAKGFYMGYDFPNLLLLPSQCAGDAGIPNGGDRAVTPDAAPGGNATTVSVKGAVSNNDYRTYFPKVADGRGILNTAHWMMAWIARACWDGQGPYYSTAGGTGPTSETWPAGGTRTSVYKYYKPNGEVYAWVNKPDAGDASTWEYYYPATGNDAEDPDDGSSPKQRINRYRDTVRSDYYLVRQGDEGDRYCAPPMNPHGDRYINHTLLGNQEKYDLDSDGLCTDWFGLICLERERHNSDYFQIYERVREKTASRECATQEIAMYRNYQWLMLEKKFMFIIPMNLNPTVCGLNIDSAAFICIEGNGFLGLANARKGSANGRWYLQGSEGDLNQTNGTVTNDPDYKDSSYRGDGRILVFANPYEILGIGLLNADVLFGVLGGGYVLPDMVGRNIYPAVNMALPAQNNNHNFQSTIASNSSVIGDDSNPVWQKRNMTFPLFAALAGVMMDGTKYESLDPGVSHNYNYDGDNRYPLATILEGIFAPLAKPRLRYWTDLEAFGVNTGRGRWVPRINNENKSGDFDFFYPSSESDPPDYRPPADLRTVVSYLAENTAGATDGLIPLLADRTAMVSRILSLLQRLGDDERATDRERIFRGLEQVMTAMKVDESEMKAGNRYATLDYSRHGWLFDRRDEDVNVMNHLTYDGPCEATSPANDADWSNFDDAWDVAGVFLGGSRDITPNLINIIDAVLAQDLTDQEIQGLLYTAGKIFGQYRGGAWQYHASDHGGAYVYDPLYDLLFAAVDLNDFMKDPATGLGDAGENYKLMTANLNALLQDRESILHYIVRNMTTRYSSERVASDLAAFLNWRVVNDPNSPLWDDLSLLLDAMADFRDRPMDFNRLLEYYGFEGN